HRDARSGLPATPPPHGSLVLNPTGAFSYTPVTGFFGTDAFTYRASDGLLQSNIATVNISIVATPPSALTYSTNPATYTKGTAITANSPTSSGGAVISYGVSPALPAGLSLNTTTGVISGTPTALAPTAGYTVTATNTGGSTTARVADEREDVRP